MNIRTVAAAISAIPNFDESHVVQILACMRSRLPICDAEKALLQVEDDIAADLEKLSRTKAEMAEFYRDRENARRAGGAIPVHHHYYGG